MTINPIGSHRLLSVQHDATPRTLADFQAKGSTAIDTRLSSLTALKNKIDGDPKLTVDQKTALEDRISSAVEGLTSLKTKLSGDTDKASAKVDLKQVYSGFRVLGVLEPSIRKSEQADHQLNSVGALQAKVSDLQAKIAAKAAAGTDVDAFNASLADLQSRLGSVSSAASGLVSQLASTSPSDVAGAQALFASADGVLGTQAGNLATARHDMKSLFDALA